MWAEGPLPPPPRIRRVSSGGRCPTTTVRKAMIRLGRPPLSALAAAIAVAGAAIVAPAVAHAGTDDDTAYLGFLRDHGVPTDTPVALKQTALGICRGYGRRRDRAPGVRRDIRRRRGVLPTQRPGTELRGPGDPAGAQHGPRAGGTPREVNGGRRFHRPAHGMGCGVDPIGNDSATTGRTAKGEDALSSDALEVISWDPNDHTDLPGLAHGLTRYGGHWFDVGVSVVPGDVDPLLALDKVFAKLRQILIDERPQVQYFTVDLRVASDTPIPHPR